MVNEIKDKERLIVLITVLIGYCALLGGIINLMMYSSNLQVNEPDTIMILVTIVSLLASYYVFEYALSILKALYYQTRYEQDLIRKIAISSYLKKQCDETYTYLLGRWYFPLVNSFILFLFLGYFFWLKSITGLIFGFIVSVLILFELFLIFELPLAKGSTFRQKWNNLFKTEELGISKIVLSSFFQLILVSLFFLFVFLFTTTVEIDLDKNIYSLNDNVQLSLYPKGIIKPLILSVNYHNTQVYSINMDSNFPRSPRYIILNSNMLKLDSYNSVILVKFSYFEKGLWSELTSNHVGKFVPVFGKFVKSRDDSIPERIINFKPLNYTEYQQKNIEPYQLMLVINGS